MTLRNCNLCLVLNLEPWIYTLPPAQTALLVFPRRSMNFKRIFCCPAVALMSIIKIKARFIFSCSYRMSHVCSFEHQSHQIVLTFDDLDRTLRGGACYWHTPGSLICDVQIWRINPSLPITGENKLLFAFFPTLSPASPFLFVWWSLILRLISVFIMRGKLWIHDLTKHLQLAFMYHTGLFHISDHSLMIAMS